MPMSLWRAQSWLLLAFGRRTQALALFDRVLRDDPNQTFALASRAHLRVEAGQVEAGADDLRRLTGLVPGEAAHWFNLGYALDQLKRPAEAAAAFEQATQLDAKLDRAWYGLGMARLQQGQVDEAIVAFKRNTELQPMSPYGWTQLARAQVRAQRPEKARKVVEHLRGFEPQVAAALARELKLES